MDSHDLLMCVSNSRSEMMAALHNCGDGDRDISLAHIPVMLKILAKVANTESSNETLNGFLRRLLDTPFFERRVPQMVNREIMGTVLIGKWTPEVALACLKDLMNVMLVCFDRMPNITYERLHLIVMGLNSLITHMNSQADVDKGIYELHQASTTPLFP